MYTAFSLTSFTLAKTPVSLPKTFACRSSLPVTSLMAPILPKRSNEVSNTIKELMPAS